MRVLKVCDKTGRQNGAIKPVSKTRLKLPSKSQGERSVVAEALKKISHGGQKSIIIVDKNKNFKGTVIEEVLFEVSKALLNVSSPYDLLE